MNINARPRPAQPKSDSCQRKHHEQSRDHGNFCARFFGTLAALKRPEVLMHFRGRVVALLRIVRARFHEHVVELEQTFAVRPRAQLRIDLREIEPVFSGARFIKKLAEAVDVGAWRAWSFRWDVTFGSDK